MPSFIHVVYWACVVMVAPNIRSYMEILVYTPYTSIYVVCGPAIYAFCTTLNMIILLSATLYHGYHTGPPAGPLIIHSDKSCVTNLP